jgi:hypothetical protein
LFLCYIGDVGEASASGFAGWPSKTRGAIDTQLIKAVDGLMQEEMEDMAEQDLPEVAFKKLQNPHLALSVDEQIECLTGCIAVGATRAKQAGEGQEHSHVHREHRCWKEHDG